MAAILDIMISMIMGSMLLLNILGAQNVVAESSSMYNGDVLVQEMLITQVQYMEGEIRNMGYGVPPTTASIISARDTAVTFLMGVLRDGTIDTVTYYCGNPSELTGTQNDMDRYIHRVVKYSSGSAEETNTGVVTYFRFRYLTLTGDTLATPVTALNLGAIRDLEISLEVQNPFAQYRPQSMVKSGQRNALYSSSFWQQTRLVSQNFRR